MKIADEVQMSSEESLTDFMYYVETVKEKHGLVDKDITVRALRSWDDENSYLTLEFCREETEAEIKKREENNANRLRYQKELDLKKLAELKAKYERINV